MRAICLIVAVFSTVFWPTSAIALDQPLDRDYGIWAPVSLKAPVWKKLEATLQLQPRFQHVPENNFTEGIVRAGIGCELNKRWSTFGGYYWSTHTNPAFNLERRLWQEVDYKHKLGSCSIQNRFRLEESQRESYVGSAIRIRHQISINYPIGGKNSKYYLALSDEPFINLNEPENGPKRGFSQNRLFVGFGKRVKETVRVETGYLNQFRNNTGSTPDLVNHALVMQISIDLTRAKRRPNKSNMKLATAGASP